MTARQKGCSLTVAALLLVLGACGEPTPRETEPPAHVEHPPVESELSRITLTSEAVARLGIETAEIRSQAIPRTKIYGGELMVPPGQALTISSPFAAMVVGELPGPGAFLQEGRELLRLLPLAPETDPLRLEAEAAARLEMARSELARAEQLLEDRAGSERRYEEAKAALAVSEATYRSIAAQLDKLKLMGITTAAGTSGYAVSSPIDGRLAKVYVADGQSVSPSTPLFEIFAEDPLWVRVPVYTGDISAIDREAAARVRLLGTRSPPEFIEAQAAAAPPVGDPNAVTMDFYYRLPNPGRRLQPGQKVSVSLSLTETEEGLTVPFGAILYDIDGGTWVYENPSPGVFQRRRVELDRVVDGLAVLRRAPPVGTSVVTVGTAELFGTEFGVGH